MSQLPTRLEIKLAVTPELPHDMNLDVAIQELVERSYEAGVAPNSRKEIEIDLSTERMSWNGYDVIFVNPTLYDGLAGVRDNCKPRSAKSWTVVDVDVEHQSPGASANHFADHYIHDVSGTNYRIFQLPDELRDSDEILRAMMKLHAPEIALDSDFVPVKSVYLAKLGLLAIGYENEADPRAETTWQKFYAESGLAQSRSDGVKRRYIGMDHGLRCRPTNFM